MSLLDVALRFLAVIPLGIALGHLGVYAIGAAANTVWMLEHTP